MLLTQLGPKAIYSVTDYWEGLRKILPIQSPILSFSTKPTAGATSPEKTTDRGYELRSGGPAIRGFDALDTTYTKLLHVSAQQAKSPTFAEGIYKYQHCMLKILG